MLKIKIERKRSPWQAPAAPACFAMAFVAAIAGSLLTTGWVLNEQQHPALHAIGLILLIVALPTVILGGHCLDLLDRKRRPPEAAERTFEA